MKNVIFEHQIENKYLFLKRISDKMKINHTFYFSNKKDYFIMQINYQFIKN
jgi:hypothetical protein